MSLLNLVLWSVSYKSWTYSQRKQEKIPLLVFSTREAYVLFSKDRVGRIEASDGRRIKFPNSPPSMWIKIDVIEWATGPETCEEVSPRVGSTLQPTALVGNTKTRESSSPILTLRNLAPKCSTTDSLPLKFVPQSQECILSGLERRWLLLLPPAGQFSKDLPLNEARLCTQVNKNMHEVVWTASALRLLLIFSTCLTLLPAGSLSKLVLEGVRHHGKINMNYPIEMPEASCML